VVFLFDWPGWQRMREWAIDAVAQLVFGLHERMDFVGAFVNHCSTRVAEISFHWEFIAESVGAVNFDSFVGGIECGFAVHPFCHGAFPGVSDSHILHPAYLVVE